MEKRLSRQAASDAVGDHGWRLVLGVLSSWVAVGSLAEAVEVASRAVAACGPQADGHLRVDVRADRVVLSLQTLALSAVTTTDTDLARAITAAGLKTEPGPGLDGQRSVQVLEIAIDALDIASVRPFWQAVLGYVDEPGADDDGPLIDPLGQGPALWFQQMDAPRPQRNRVHFDVSVPHDEAARRIEATVAAGGRVLSDVRAPAFWVLADPEGNEACVTTWQARDPH
ncbi:4a-hydroxytetrahydrobiopterin dehydratase [Actinoplanes sp. TRM 88003]|uniref:4a-hydroxytetrahydrobiopterin dehydratase n=1 Tax=Paractinoplanes aksuensis TaxID=2939490 RepID=A0ABT1DIM2_9ACTN|nr:VOC family protein [Actinoplanes aksuensis]MCO8270660.1 4a-hydroxytetrahydrobiopterin dehydratase [Actinoplanes aksuensis]